MLCLLSPASESWALYNDNNRIVFTNVFICYGAYLSNNVAAPAPEQQQFHWLQSLDLLRVLLFNTWSIGEERVGLPYIHQLNQDRPPLWVRFGLLSGQDNLGIPGQRALA